MEGGDKRELTYCALSLLLPVVALFTGIFTLEDLVSHVVTQYEIPLQIVTFFLLSEITKLAIAFTLFATTQEVEAPVHGWRRLSKPSKLPTYSRKEHSVAKHGGIQSKVIKIWKGCWHFLCCCALCYVFCVLFGAPFLHDFVLTVEFSVVLVSLTFTPLCFYFPPTSVLVEVASISLWDTRLNSIWRAKFRFLFCVAGSMAGSALIPLDWDRPWQRWPIPCLLTLSICYIIVNALSILFLLYTNALKSAMFSKSSCNSNNTESNVRGGKVKNF